MPALAQPHANDRHLHSQPRGTGKRRALSNATSCRIKLPLLALRMPAADGGSALWTHSRAIQGLRPFLREPGYPWHHFFVIGSDSPPIGYCWILFLSVHMPNSGPFDSATRTPSIPAVKAGVSNSPFRLTAKISGLSTRAQLRNQLCRQQLAIGSCHLASIQAGPTKWRMGVCERRVPLDCSSCPCWVPTGKLTNVIIYLVLPEGLPWEHTSIPTIFRGEPVFAITSSYRLEDGRYLRIDDNRCFGLCRLAPGKISLSAPWSVSGLPAS